MFMRESLCASTEGLLLLLCGQCGFALGKVLLPQTFRDRDDLVVKARVPGLVAADQQHSVPLRAERVDDPEGNIVLLRLELAEGISRALQGTGVGVAKPEPLQLQ